MSGTDDLLKDELAALQAIDFNLDGVGFSDTEVQEILGPNEGQTDPDETPDPPAELISQPGDLWVLGNHRLICGDCTDKATVVRLLDGETPNLMVTDPPYGVEYDAELAQSG